MSNILQSAIAAFTSAVVRNKKSSSNYKNGNKKDRQYNIFQKIYRTLCYIGLKIQFKTYNFRRRIKKLLRPIGNRIALFCCEGVAIPVRDSFSEFVQICGELKNIPSDVKRLKGKSSKKTAGANAKRAASLVSDKCKAHKSFFVGTRNFILPILCIGVLAFVAFSITSSSYALEVSYNGKVLGYIEDEGVYNTAVQLLRERVISSSEDYKSTLTPTYSLVPVSKNVEMDSEELCEAILADSESVESAYGLYIDGELCAAAKSYGDIQFIMQSFLDQYKTGVKGETVSFLGKTEIVSGLFSTDKILSSEDFAQTISTKRTETQVYTVKDGENAQSIATAANMSYERLMELNEGLSDTPEEGASVLLEKELPVLAVKTVRTETVTENIAFSKETIKDNDEYTTYSNCITPGKNGKRSVVQQITEINGVQVSRDVLSSEVIEEPVNAVYVVGTKKASKVGSGLFTWPLPGVRTISSPFGYRWGRLHSGVDISTSGVYGRTVVAADSGTVTVKNSASGYGLHVIISHGNGYSTYYAHLSAVNVSTGQVVGKGQAIGKVGNSGSSTGPHLHFEIRVNNSPKNPMNYF